jgi:hypothetical protein
MVFEDAHWSDPSSRELLDLTVERIQGLPVLVFVTFRPEFVPPWTGQSQVVTLTLSRLNRRNGAVLAKRIFGNETVTDNLIDDIVERTDGVPLFIEELTKSVMHTGLRTEDFKKEITTAPSLALSVPATLHAPLMALMRWAALRIWRKSHPQLAASSLPICCQPSPSVHLKSCSQVWMSWSTQVSSSRGGLCRTQRSPSNTP